MEMEPCQMVSQHTRNLSSVSLYLQTEINIFLSVCVTIKVMDIQVVELPNQQNQVSEWSQLHTKLFLGFDAY